MGGEGERETDDGMNSGESEGVEVREGWDARGRGLGEGGEAVSGVEGDRCGMKGVEGGSGEGGGGRSMSISLMVRTNSFTQDIK